MKQHRKLTAAVGAFLVLAVVGALGCLEGPHAGRALASAPAACDADTVDTGPFGGRHSPPAFARPVDPMIGRLGGGAPAGLSYELADGEDQDTDGTEDIEAWAVIIGVSDYRELEPPPSPVPPWEDYDLTYAAEDARGLYWQLSPALGADRVRLLVDSGASRASIEDAVVNWLVPQEGPEDIVMFFFSGHGDSSHIRPHDSLTTSHVNDIAADELDEWLGLLESEKVVVMLDCCESAGFASALAGDGRVILASSAASEGAWEFPEIEHGVFSHYLIHSFEDPASVDVNADRNISAEEIFDYLDHRVTSHAVEHLEEQHPQLYDGNAAEVQLFSIVTISSHITHGIAPVVVDGTEYAEAQPPVSLTWVAGTVHIISVPVIVPVAEGTRYAFASWSDGWTSMSRVVIGAEMGTLTADYKTQYYLTVRCDYGEPRGEGWYDEGSEATFEVCGGGPWQWRFGGWSGDSDTEDTTATIVMDGPKTVVGGRDISSYIKWLGVVIVILMAVVLVAVARFGTRRL